ncbi:MAG: Tk-subtilisin precursor [Candidatus Methanolliviera sp. GoM_oil]|nr:MAG: Tk-subtilisin precursor [Candidatus Methanolliviera sp. GoM_oil]
MNFVGGNSYADDENGHGTAIASIIKDIAPRSNLFITKIADKNGDAHASDIIAGIDWAVKNNVDIITLNVYNRIGKEDLCPVTLAIENAVKKGVVCVLPAGNSGEDVKNFQPSNSENAIVVMSCNSKSKPSSFSNWGGDIFALGEDIATESIKNPKIGEEMNDERVKVGGTSFASAEVTGAAALLEEKNPLLAPDDIKSILWKSSKNKGQYYRGIGELDIEEALKRCPKMKEVII